MTTCGTLPGAILFYISIAPTYTTDKDGPGEGSQGSQHGNSAADDGDGRVGRRAAGSGPYFEKADSAYIDDFGGIEDVDSLERGMEAQMVSI